MKIIRPDYEDSILNVSNSLLKYYNVTPFHQTHPVLDKELESKYNHIIYILLDGMGHNIVSKLDDHQALKKYTIKPITSVFPPTTVAATNSVLSGKTPIETGYLGWVQYFKQVDSDVTVFLNKDFYNNKTYDYNVRNTFLKYPNILDLAKKQNPELNTNMFFPSFIEELGTSKSFKEEIEQVLLVTHNTDYSFNYLYWTEPDLTEHKYGIYSKETTKTLQKLNTDFTELIENINEDTLVICIADHGLTDVEEINIFKSETLINMLERKPSIEPRAINFFVKPVYKEAFKDEFNRLYSDKYNLFTTESLLESELFGKGEKHELVDMFLGDYIAIAVDKYMFSINDIKSYKAHHAGLTSDEMLVPLIIYKK